MKPYKTTDLLRSLIENPPSEFGYLYSKWRTQHGRSKFEKKSLGCTGVFAYYNSAGTRFSKFNVVDPNLNKMRNLDKNRLLNFQD